MRKPTVTSPVVSSLPSQSLEYGVLAVLSQQDSHAPKLMLLYRLFYPQCDRYLYTYTLALL